jgi:hypothetical protein
MAYNYRMSFLVFIPYYFFWHYGRGFKEAASNIFNLVAFIFKFFSIKSLLATLFTPWERMGESYRRGFNLEAWAETFIVNTILRFVGFVVRFLTIIFGLTASLLGLFLALTAIIFWLVAPFLLLFILSLGLVNLFS